MLQGKITQEEAKEARGRVSIVAPEKGLAGIQDADMVIEVSVINNSEVSRRAKFLFHLGSVRVFSAEASHLSQFSSRAPSVDDPGE